MKLLTAFTGSELVSMGDMCKKLNEIPHLTQTRRVFDPLSDYKHCCSILYFISGKMNFINKKL
jgi:hypothetical protein